MQKRTTEAPPPAALDWDELRYALAIAEAGSLNGAAQQLGVRHSTVLRRLDALELRLGVRLFERRRQGYAPTEAGELMAAQARQMQPAIAELERRIIGRDLQLQGTLRLSTPFIGLLYLLPEALAAFQRRHPGIRIELDENSALVDLAQRDADVCLRISEKVPEHWVGRRLGELQMQVYARRGATDLPQALTPLETLCRDHRWIGFDRERRGRFYDRWLQDHVAAERVVIHADLLHAAVPLARAGMGLALLPRCVAAQEPELLPVSAPIAGLAPPVWLLTHADLRQSARIRRFLDEVGADLSRALA